MNDYNITVITEPVHEENDWDRLVNVLDEFPGTALVEDVNEPRFHIPLEAENSHTAHDTISEYLASLGIEYVYMRVEDENGE